MKSFQLGTNLTFTGCTSPPLIRRSDASPDAETMSYWLPPPWRIRVTISFEEPAYLACTWQPVAFWNGSPQWGCVYPPHAPRWSAPSPAPIVCGGFDGVLLPPPLVLDDDLLSFEEP